jgi:hypothetical protein
LSKVLATEKNMKNARKGPQIAILREWLGDRTQGQGAHDLGISAPAFSVLFRGHEPGLGLKIKIREVVGIPLSTWETPELLDDSDLARPPGVRKNAAESGIK